MTIRKFYTNNLPKLNPKFISKFVQYYIKKIYCIYNSYTTQGFYVSITSLYFVLSIYHFFNVLLYHDDTILMFINK